MSLIYLHYFTIHLQDADVTALPATHTEYLKEIARDYRGSQILATAYPLGDTWDSKWFIKWYNEGGSKEYLQLDTRTEAGRLAVARFNDYEKEWAAKLESLENTNETHNMIYELLYLHTKKGNKDDIYGSSTEGLHRGLAIMHTLVKSKVNPFTGEIVPNSLTL